MPIKKTVAKNRESAKSASPATPTAPTYNISHCTISANSGTVSENHASAVIALAAALGKNADALAEAARTLKVEGGKIENGIYITSPTID